MRISNRTQVNPLILNFMTPATINEVSANALPQYDPINQITWFLGGGNGGSKKATRSNDGYKRTDDNRGNGTVYTHNDTERYTDD